jgi:preprotein translocase subunit SecY
VIDSFRNIFAIPDLRKRVLFTFALLAVYRIGAFIPIPGVDPVAIKEFTTAAQGTVLGFLNLFSGGALGRMTVFALGIMPYISASIILQPLTVVWPYLEKLSKEGELGRRKITQYTRYGTVVLSVIQGMGISFFLERTTAPGGAPLVPEDLQGWGFRLMTVLTLTTGTAFVMWLGEQITERGIGNGISLIIFAGIVVGLPSAIINTITDMRTGSLSIITIAILLVFMIAVVAAIVYMERAQRRIPIQYAKRVVGRRVYGGQSTYLPLRLNTGGVIPVIFAASIMSFPQTLGQMFDNRWLQRITEALNYGEPLQPDLLPVHRILLLLLHVDHLQPRGHRREHAQVRRLHPGHPPRQTDRRVHRPDPHPHHAGRRPLPGAGGDPAADPDLRLQGGDHSRDRTDPRCLPAPVVHRGPGHQVLLRRHLAADRGRRRHGHGATDRVAAGHAAL